MLSKIEDIEFVFSKIIYINAFLVPIALVFLKLKFLDNYFWYYVPFTPDFPVIPRLKMFTYEASYYSLLLVPLFFYVFWNFLFHKNLRTNLMIVMIVTPLLLSFSLGVLSGIAITIFIVFISNVSSLIRQKRAFKILSISLLSILFGVVILFKFFPDNALVIRIKNIPTGKDTSARGRTYEAFDLANKIAKKKSVWFGVGLGQIKEMGRATIVQYYQYTKIPETIRIPNAVAETYAIYGLVGLIIRFGTLIFLFFKTKVFQNYFRLSLFVFVFIYQFTGSFIFNIVEFVIWILAFSKVLPQFNKVVSYDK